MVEIRRCVHVARISGVKNFVSIGDSFVRGAVQPGKVRKRERLGRWRLRRPLFLFLGLWPKHCDATIGKRVGVRRRCPERTRTGSPAADGVAVRRTWLRGRRISNRKWSSGCPWIEVGNGAFPVAQPGPAATVAFRSRRSASIFAAAAGLAGGSPFASSANEHGNRASAKTAANHRDTSLFKLKMCILLSYLFLPNLNDPAIPHTQSVRIHCTLVRDPRDCSLTAGT